MGEITAKLSAREGAKVVATDLQEDKLKTVVDNINAEFGDVAIAVKHNVASEEDWINVVEQVKNKFGEISILVNNAGLGGKVEALTAIVAMNATSFAYTASKGNFRALSKAAEDPTRLAPVFQCNFPDASIFVVPLHATAASSLSI